MRFRHLLWACAGALAWAHAAGAGDPPPVTSFGSHLPDPGITLSNSRRTAVVTPSHPELGPVRYYRLRLKVANPTNAGWTITVRTSAGQVLTSFDADEKACEGENGCWTGRLGAEAPRLHFSADSNAVSATVVEGVFMPAEAKNTFYSPMPGSVDEKLSAIRIPDADARAALVETGDALGLFIGSGLSPEGAEANWCCSGVQLTDTLFMTNWHCGAVRGMGDSAFWSTAGANACDAAVVDLSWDEDASGREFGCGQVEFLDKDLDVAILRLARIAGGLPLGRPLRRPALSSRPLRAGEPIRILHHPACKPKSVTQGCTVLDPAVRGWTGAAAPGAGESEFTHNCTTEAGSSGGPVFSAGFEMIGLHRAGVDIGRGLPGNFAVGMHAILAALRVGRPEIHEELTGAFP